MRRLAPLVAVLLSSAALVGCASAGDIAKASADKASKAADSDSLAKTVPTDLDSGIRQAQLLRQAGQFDEAVHLLSQLMLVASDDPRVVGEYGKTLAEMGRAQDAVQFLTRATELKGNDWSTYSALGVAYDQVGDQASARAAYERALAINPSEPSILNNYALSRMLAHDPETARQLMARARAAGGVADPKIARNIALVDRMMPAPAKVAQPTAPPPAPAPRKAASPAANPQPAPSQTASTAPKPLAPANPPASQPSANSSAANSPAKAAPAVATPPLVKTAAAKPVESKVADAKPADGKNAGPAAKKAAAEGVPSLRLAADGY